MPPAPGFSLYRLLDDLPRLKVIDVGASHLDGQPPYHALYEAGRVDLVGFEPNPEQLKVLHDLKRPHATYLPHAIGDGSDGVLHICQSPGMTSLFEPDPAVLEHFHGFAGWGKVVRTEPCPTRRFDDIPEAAGADYLKVDVQGGELGVFAGAARVLDDLVVVHTEVQFVPFYKDQPLFAELDQALRRAGFFLHRFLPIHSRVFKPMMVRKDIYAGMSQVLWTDAVYVRRFTDFARLSVPQLLKIAAIAHDLYQSFDLAALALGHADGKKGGQRRPRYIGALAGR